MDANTASRWHRFGTWAYRHIATAAGRHLGGNDIVQSILVRRSVAAGEVDFGRSDIDLTIVLKGPTIEPEETERLLALSRSFRRMRRYAPVIGECFAFPPEEMERSYRADSYRASLERRCGLFAYGPKVEIPDMPVTLSGAIFRTVCWFYGYVPIALKHGNRRNLRKFAIEIWNAYATITGLIEQPYVTRRETLQAWQRAEPGLEIENKTPTELFGLCCGLAGRVHAACRPPLPKLEKPLCFGTNTKNVVVIPAAGHPVPPCELGWGTMIATPEILDLYFRNVSTSDHARFSAEAAGLGIAPPEYEDYLVSCGLALDPFRLRTIGFLGSPSLAQGAVRASKRVEVMLPYLERGECPPLELLRGFPEADPNQRIPSDVEYYREWYPSIWRGYRSLWNRLDLLPRKATPALRG